WPMRPRDRLAIVAASSGGMPRRVNSAATALRLSGSSGTGWQRERIVSGGASASAATRMRTTTSGGCSSALSSASRATGARHRLATGADRLRECLCLGGDEDEDDEGRRLLQRLEQRVKGVAGEEVAFGDDGDAPAALHRPQGDRCAKVADGLDGDAGVLAVA